MKKKAAFFLVAIFFVNLKGMEGGIVKGAAKSSSELYVELGAPVKDNQDEVLVCQPKIEVKSNNCSVCYPVEKCIDVCCEKHMKATFIACALAFADKAIFLGLI